jgi:SAM-dependent methyltransferase
MNALDYIKKKYSVMENKGIIRLPISRWDALPTLFKELGYKKGVEIGVYKGNFSEVLCRLIPSLDLTSVDAWLVYKGYKDYGVRDLETEAYNLAVERSKKYGFKIIKAWSQDAVNSFEDESLDFVFIDGNHDFKHVVEDVDAWSKKVRKGGIVAGHDFFRNHYKDFGVREALPAWCEYKEIPILFVVAKDKCPSWFYIKQ